MNMMIHEQTQNYYTINRDHINYCVNEKRGEKWYVIVCFHARTIEFVFDTEYQSHCFMLNLANLAL
jgi:hypothetical protein